MSATTFVADTMSRMVVPRHDLVPPRILKNHLSSSSWEVNHAQCYCSIFRLCGKTNHAFVGVLEFLTERRLAAARVGLSMEVSKELGPVEAVPTAVLGNLTIIVELLRKS